MRFNGFKQGLAWVSNGLEQHSRNQRECSHEFSLILRATKGLERHSRNQKDFGIVPKLTPASKVCLGGFAELWDTV